MKNSLGDWAWTWRLGMDLETGHEAGTFDTKSGHEDHLANEISKLPQEYQLLNIRLLHKWTNAITLGWSGAPFLAQRQSRI
jgi:hypothetical protein